jgi:hypothetical protein
VNQDYRWAVCPSFGMSEVVYLGSYGHQVNSWIDELIGLKEEDHGIG